MLGLCEECPMYVRNDTNVPILYTIVGGVVAQGTILPGGAEEIDSREALDVSFATDDGSPLPTTLTVALSM